MSDNETALYSVRLERAREPGLPEGSSRDGYEFVVPLDGEARIDPEAWRKARKDCLVARFRQDEAPAHGWLARKPGGAWYFDYEKGEDEDDETGFRFGEESFVVGEYVSIKEQDGLHTYRITLVEPL